MPAMPLPSSMFASTPSMSVSSAASSGSSANIAAQKSGAQDDSPSFSSVLKQKTGSHNTSGASPPPPNQQTANTPETKEGRASGQETVNDAAHDASASPSHASIVATLLGFNAKAALQDEFSRNGADLATDAQAQSLDANGQATLAALLAQQMMSPAQKTGDDRALPQDPDAASGHLLLSDTLRQGAGDRASADFASLAEKAVLQSALHHPLATGNPTESIAFDQTFAAAHAQISLAGQDSHSRLGDQTVTSFRMETPVGARGWDQEVGNKLVWMAGKQEQNAELVLHPPQLGRVEISLHLKGEQATATFVAANPVARDALENALPRLREMFADAGLSLGQAHVGAESNHQQAAAQRGNDARSPRFSPAMTGIEEGNMPTLGAMSGWQVQGRGLVDTFA